MSAAAATPVVTVVIPTRDRPEMVRAAIDAVLSQDYAGTIEVLVVHDGSEPDASLSATQDERSVRVLTNSRPAGLAGARNTGLLAAAGELVAFCDDDDTWEPAKLTAQVRLLLSQPDAEFCSSGILVDFEGRMTPRLAGSTAVTHAQLVRSRMAMLHSSTFLMRRDALLDGIGLVDEEIPGGQNEDWDLLLRAAERRPVLVVDEPLVRVRWGRTSFYSRRWDTKVEALTWMLAHHPGIERDKVGAARVYGQVAFAHASAGRRREGLRWARRATRRHPQEWRAVAATVVALRLVSGERVLEGLHRFGRGV